MLAQRMEVDLRKPLLRQPHVVGAGAQVGQRVGRVVRHAQRVGVGELAQLGGVSAVIQRAPVYWQPSRRTSQSYSAFRRCCTTSNCSWPTAPSSMLPPASGLKTWIAPSSPSCARPCCSCLVRSGFFSTTVMNISGAKKGRPVNCRLAPSVMVSPSCTPPWVVKPMMSPA
jgi:hypothetical protein